MSNRQVSLRLALESHQAGRLSEAALLYRELLLADPQNADAFHLFGVLMHQLGQPGTAVELISRAIAIKPFCAPYHLNLGNAQLALKHRDAAVGSYTRAAECDPRCIDAYINLGNVSLSEKRYEAAAESYARAVARDPDCRDALVLLGLAWIESGDTAKAKTALDSALELDPGHGLAHMFSGYARARSEDHAASLPFFQEAVRLDPQRDEAHNHLGAAYEALGRYAEAAAAFSNALALKPLSVEYLVNVGLNKARRRDKSGIGCIEQAVALDGNHAAARTTLGEALLAFGEYERGWKEYEWRWKKPEFAVRDRPFNRPRWDGQPLNGKVILLHAEQGYGDTIQFARFVAEVFRRGGKIVLEVQEGLQRLLSTVPGVRACLRQGIDPLPEFDVHCPLMSLPHALRTTQETIPPPLPIPCCESPGPLDNRDLRIGLVWGGNPKHIRDKFRSMPLAALEALRALPNTAFTCLQKDVPEEDQRVVRDFPMECPLTTEGDYLDTAAIVARLDLVLSVDTSVAHLAASMGKPVWLLLPEAADWRWGVAGERSVWYPSMTLFRQTSEGDWAELLQRVARRLAESRQRTSPFFPEPSAPSFFLKSETRTHRVGPPAALSLRDHGTT